MVAAGNIIRAADINNLVAPYYAVCTGNVTFTTGTGNVRQDITGLTFDVTTVNPNAVVDVSWAIDTNIVTIVAGNNFQFRLEIDGVAQSPLALCSTAVVNFRSTSASQGMQVTHALPGTYTYQITGLSASATAGATVFANTSTLRALCIDLAA